MKCCGEEMKKIAREDYPGVFLICEKCCSVTCPDPPVNIREIGR